jgi:hypothetical protein
MPLSNFERMIQLADDVFSAQNDPAQLEVDEKVMGWLVCNELFCDKMG